MISSRTILIASAAALFLGAGASPIAHAAPADFYQAPAQVPATPGALIRTEQFTPAFGPLLGIAHADRVMYVSTDSRNRPIPVTGTVFTPRAAWTGSGARPMVSVGAGTHGQGPQCVSSRAFTEPVRVHGPADISLSYEQPSVKALLDRGFTVAVTDYMQSGGIQTYLNRTDQGKSMIDIVRAARRLPGIAAQGPVGFWGYSQGGAAAAAAAELQPAYAPEIAVRAVYAGAPPADLGRVLAQADNGILAAAAGWVVNSALAADPALRPHISARLNDLGNQFLASSRGQCLAGALVHGFQPSSRYTRSGQPLISDLLAVPGFAKWLQAQQLGNSAPGAAALVHSARTDDVVPFDVQTGLVQRWQAKGGTVEHFVFEAPAVFPGSATSHSLPHQLDNDRAYAWFAGQFAH